MDEILKLLDENLKYTKAWTQIKKRWKLRLRKQAAGLEYVIS